MFIFSYLLRHTQHIYRLSLKWVEINVYYTCFMIPLNHGKLFNSCFIHPFLPFSPFLLPKSGMVFSVFFSMFTSVQFSRSVVSNSVTPWIAACQAALSITNSQSLPKLMSIKSLMPSSHLILCRPLSFCPQSLPASWAFPMSQLFSSGGQSIGVSASA